MSKKFQSASLDHVMWFHGKVNFNNWILHHMHSQYHKMREGSLEDQFILSLEN